MRIFFKISLVIALLAVTVSVLRPGPIERDLPRDLPWQLPDYRQADVHWEVGSDGKIYNTVQHFYLEGITPAMVSWFYQVLPVATVDYRGRTYPMYHIFHPTEHGTLSVLEPALDGRPGMGPGAVISREEWFGPHDSRGAARLVEFSDAGMLAVPEALGMVIGEVRHVLTAREGGTDYRVEAMIGSDLPVIGALLNWYLRTQVFPPEMMEQWQRHQVEEVASLQFFLADIYAQGENKLHFVLDR